MDTEQALVAAGGTGQRLREKGVEVPVAKSFLEVEDRPLLYWCLEGLHEAGIEEIVLAAEEEHKLEKAGEVVDSSPYEPHQVELFNDPGLGTTGLPFQARHLLDDQLFFEFGHHATPPEHYRAMDEVKASEIVVSAYRAENHTDRPEIHHGDKTIVLSSPYLLDRGYVSRLPEHDFKIDDILQSYTAEGELEVVTNDGPVEPDVPAELERAEEEYRTLVG